MPLSFHFLCISLVIFAFTAAFSYIFFRFFSVFFFAFASLVGRFSLVLRMTLLACWHHKNCMYAFCSEKNKHNMEMFSMTQKIHQKHCVLFSLSVCSCIQMRSALVGRSVGCVFFCMLFVIFPEISASASLWCMFVPVKYQSICWAPIFFHSSFVRLL